MPDNLSTGADGRIWCAMFSPANATLDWLTPRAALLRKLVWRMPERMQPQIKPEVWVVAFDPNTGAPVTGVHMTHPRFGTVTGVVEADGKLWMGSIGAAAVAHCPLP
jgi:hypothetical protein